MAAPRLALPDQSDVSRQIACWTAVLLGACMALIFFQYQYDWSAAADRIVGIQRTIFLWLLGGLALLALLGLFYVINRQTRRLSDFHLARARRAEDAVEHLKTEIATACGDDVDPPIARWRVKHAAQADEINHAGREVASLVEAIDRVRESVYTAAGQAQDCVGAAQQGAAAAQTAVVGINDTHSRIQAAAGQLQQLAQNTRRFKQTSERIRDTTEQAWVLSLNVAIQEQGQADPVATAEEMQHLTDRVARAAGEAAELTRIIQSHADSLITALETLAGETAAGGAALANETALAEMETASRELQKHIERAAGGMAGESARARAIGERMDKLRAAAEQSGAHATRLADGMAKLKVVAGTVQSSAAPGPSFDRR